jgi:hypothetical protein
MEFARQAHTVHRMVGGRIEKSGPPGEVIE